MYGLPFANMRETLTKSRTNERGNQQKQDIAIKIKEGLIHGYNKLSIASSNCTMLLARFLKIELRSNQE
jgi:hypothetical protein